MSFNEENAIRIAQSHLRGNNDEIGLDRSFAVICCFLYENPDRLSGKGKSKPELTTNHGINHLAEKFFSGYRRSDFPVEPSTVPDTMVSEVLKIAYDYSYGDCERIKKEHQKAMSAENCVGAILERYIDSVIRSHGWSWCCGNLVKAVDFLKREPDGTWKALQIKNRNNSENSSSSAIRSGTTIQKWFRSRSKTGTTNWGNLPGELRDYGLSEEGFQRFVAVYLNEKKEVL